MSGQRRWRPFALALVAAMACQDYAFETRVDLLSRARRIKEVITTVTPADILFVIDNSGSMIDELAELENNIGLFIDELTASANDYQIGFITPDVECNIPGARNCTAGGTSLGCCTFMQCTAPSQCAAGQTCTAGQCVCADNDLDANGVVESSSCDGGRLRADPGSGRRIFRRPPDGELETWKQTLRDTIGSVGCHGSGYEATLEAVRRAAICAKPGVTIGPAPDQCPHAAIADLNAGFLRPNADLVIIFVTDEDDCSFLPPQSDCAAHADQTACGADAACTWNLARVLCHDRLAIPTAYKRPTDNTSAAEQGSKYCTPHECYAYLGATRDGDTDGLWDWSDPDTTPDSARRFTCGVSSRTVNPPLPGIVADFLDGVVAAKGGEVSRVRAGAILGGVVDAAAPLGFRGVGCYSTTGGPSATCGCWANASDVLCTLTGLTEQNQNDRRDPPGGQLLPACGDDTPMVSPGGCEAMTGGRILTFLQDLSSRRAAADVYVDSICQPQYSDTMEQIATLLALDTCFDIGQVIPDDQKSLVRIVYDGRVLDDDDWTMVASSTTICLQKNRFEPRIGARFEIFLLDDN